MICYTIKIVQHVRLVTRTNPCHARNMGLIQGIWFPKSILESDKTCKLPVPIREYRFGTDGPISITLSYQQFLYLIILYPIIQAYILLALFPLFPYRLLYNLSDIAGMIERCSLYTIVQCIAFHFGGQSFLGAKQSQREKRIRYHCIFASLCIILFHL